MEEKKKGFDAKQTGKELIAGTMNGFAQVLVGQPFDIVKVRLQTQSRTNPIYNGMFDCVKKILANEGPLSFYKGTLPPLLGVGAAVSIQFGTNEGSKFNLSDPLPLPYLCLSGSIAGIANCSVITPVEHLRIRMQIQTSENKIYSGSIDAAKKIFKQFGLKGIYKGNVACIGREAVAFCAYFSTYETLSYKLLKPNQTKKDLPMYKTMFAGGIAGFMYWTTCYPFDLIKSKMQVDDLANPKYKNALQVFREIKKSGIGEFYRGYLPCAVRSVPVNACGFLAFETTMNFLGREESS